MPKLVDLATCSVHMYAADHLPPHFHVRMNDGREALIEIATLEVLRGNIAQREMRPALAWAQANRTLLATQWKVLNR